MWPSIMTMEWRRALGWFPLWVAAGLGYLCFAPGVLHFRDGWMVLLGTTLGVLSAAQVFSEPRGASAFIFSQPLKRQKLFWLRWLAGTSLVIAGLAILSGAMALGLRMVVQGTLTDSPWYPMVPCSRKRLLAIALERGREE